MLVLARGGDPPEPPLARGPVPSSRGLGRAARGATPLEPPAGSRPRFFVTRPLAVLPGGATPLEPPAGSRPRSFVTRPLAVLPGGATPLEPPAGSRPRSFVTRPWPCCPGGDPPGTPRWLKAVRPWGQPPEPLRGPGWSGAKPNPARAAVRCGRCEAGPGRPTTGPGGRRPGRLAHCR